MNNPKRVRVYQWQLGFDGSCVTVNGFWGLTPAQRRRLNKKFHKNPEANVLSIENMELARLGIPTNIVLDEFAQWDINPV